uniref:Uncharacterized protein n=1 Tax=Oryza punctata TaxID=4537 RepID=A0A0E0K4F2_ORYPU
MTTTDHAPSDRNSNIATASRSSIPISAGSPSHTAPSLHRRATHHRWAVKIPTDPHLNCRCITRCQVAIAPPPISSAATALLHRRYSPGRSTTATFNYCIKTSLRSITVLEGGVPENSVIPDWIK